MTISIRYLGLAVATLMLAMSQTAHATITFTEKNSPQPGEENILFKNSEIGNPISGFTNQTNVEVVFASLTGQTLFQGAKGQADIENAADPGKALLNSMDITTPDHGFTDFIMNPLNGTGTATVTVFTDVNQVHVYDLKNGQNFLTIVATGG